MRVSKYFIVFVALFFGAQSQAEGEPWDVDAEALAQEIEECLIIGRDDLTECSDFSSICMQGEGGMSTAGMSNCVNAEEEAWDILLNRYYGELLVTYSNRDDVNVEENFRQAQRSWVEYRENECRYRRLRFGTGSIAINISASCYLEFTQSRAIEFFLELDNEY